jgi:hypothetical protein
MSFGYFEFMSDMDENGNLESHEHNPETPETNPEVSQDKGYEDIEDKYAYNYADAYVTDRLDIFNAHNPILAGVDLKVTKPDPINFGKVFVGQSYHSSFNIMMQGCKNPVFVTTSAEGVTLTPAILSAKQLNEGAEVDVDYIPTEAQGLYGVLDESIGFNGELQGIKLDVKAEVFAERSIPVIKFSESTCTYALGDEITSETFPTLTSEEGLEVTYTSSDPEVAYMDENNTIRVLKVGSTTFTATTTETDKYQSASASFTLEVVPEKVNPEPEQDSVVMAAAKASQFSKIATEIAGSLNEKSITSAEFSLLSISDSAYPNSFAVVLNATENETSTVYYFPIADGSNKLIGVAYADGVITETSSTEQSATNAVNNAMRAEYNSAMNIANNTENVTYSNKGWVINADADQIAQFPGAGLSSMISVVTNPEPTPTPEPEEPEQESQTHSVVNAELTGNDGEKVTLLNNN